MKKKLWISAGEVSGDLQGGAVLESLKKYAGKNLEAIGMGGDYLEAAGQKNFFRVEELSVMGIGEVISSLPKVLKLLARIREKMREEKPDAVLLIDAPDFNFRIAKIAKKLHIPVYYFIPPKVWAWRKGRIRFLKKHIRRVFSILPFEVPFYESHGMGVSYIGNPIVDMVNYPAISHIEPIAHRIGLMPGSRIKEVESLLPQFAGAAELLAKKFPDLEFFCIRSQNFSEEYLRSLWKCDLPLEFVPASERYEFMRTCEYMIAASGTATLETGLAGVPTLVAYKVSPLTYWVASHFLKVKWISLTNIILNRSVFPENIQADADAAPIAAQMEKWLENPEEKQRILRDLEELRTICGECGSTDRMAQALWQELNAKYD